MLYQPAMIRIEMSSNSNAHDALTELGYSITDTGGGVEQYLWVHEPS